MDSSCLISLIRCFLWVSRTLIFLASLVKRSFCNNNAAISHPSTFLLECRLPRHNSTCVCLYSTLRDHKHFLSYRYRFISSISLVSSVCNQHSYENIRIYSYYFLAWHILTLSMSTNWCLHVSEWNIPEDVQIWYTNISYDDCLFVYFWPYQSIHVSHQCRANNPYSKTILHIRSGGIHGEYTASVLQLSKQLCRKYILLQDSLCFMGWGGRTHVKEKATDFSRFFISV